MMKLKINSFPFYWRINNKLKKHHSIPSKMPYLFKVMSNTNLLIEARNSKLLAILNKVYKEDSNIGFLRKGHSLANSYGEDFYKFLKSILVYLKGKKILEVGCGGCYILDKLKKLNYNVYGVDPGPLAKREGLARGIKIVNDFYPSKKIDFKVDLIFHVDVLEHISNPLLILQHHYKNLNEEGFIVINVPDVTEGVSLGDISIATHQHLNSFTKNSLHNLVEKAGFYVVKINKSGFGGSLYCLASKKKPLKKRKFIKKQLISENRNFFLKSKKAIIKFNKKINNCITKGETIGFYMPLRAFPYIASSKFRYNYRLFDDQKHWHRKFIDGENRKIENFDDLIKKPVDHLFVMSTTFGKLVKNKVKKKLKDIRITLIKELLNG